MTRYSPVPPSPGFHSPVLHFPALRRIAVAGLALLLTGLAACSSPAASGEPGGAGSPSQSGAATDGGTVRVGILGSGGDSLDVTQASSFISYGVALNTFDSLAVMSHGEAKLQLAESITPNADATGWTIVIHDGVRFHDGTEVTADDVLASLTHLATAPIYGSMFADIDLTGATSDGDRTVTLSTARPRADLVESVLAQMSIVFLAAMPNFDKPIGSGPFIVQSHDPDTGTVLVRNDDYWGGKPGIERLEFVPILDAGARMTALLDDQLDYAMGVTPTGIETIPAGAAVAVQDPGAAESSAFSFQLNAGKSPFDDPEVREAFRLAVDRQALVDVVFRGKGEVGNDIVGKGMQGYDDSIPQRERDLDKAKQVFTSKGVTAITVLASEMTPGITDAAKLLAQQLAEVGVEVTINESDPATLFADPSVIANNNVFSFYAINRPFAAHAPMFNVDGAPGNYFGNTFPAFTEKITASQATTDTAARTALLNEAQRIFWESGADTVWGFQPVLAAHDEALTGVEIVQSVPAFHQASYRR